jgi:hypothetical protein
MILNRRQFVRIVPALGAFSITSRAARAQNAQGPVWPSPPPGGGPAADEAFPTHHPSLARDIVGASHANVARVNELLKRRPELAKASWDWGFGDWETALGAASHVGNRTIAGILLANGAVPTIFSAAMLGQLEVVKGFAAAMPDVQQLRGPHGIPLINHARAGGAQAAEVVAYLESIGASPKTGDVEPLSPADRSSIEGRYAFGDGVRDVFVVDSDKNGLGITRLGASRRVLTHLGKLEFHPVGAPGVRIRFVRSDTGVALHVFYPDLIVRAGKT